MKIEITKINTIKNIFKNKLYLLILLGSIVVAVLLPVTAQKIVVPAFYKQMITNTLDDAKKMKPEELDEKIHTCLFARKVFLKGNALGDDFGTSIIANDAGFVEVNVEEESEKLVTELEGIL